MPDETEKTEKTETAEKTENKGMLQPTATSPTAPPAMLTRPTDLPVRPGFRSPANNKSKAQKKKR